MYQEDFEEIRPFHDSEINAVLNGLAKNPFFSQVLHLYFPPSSHQDIIKLLSNTHSSFDFQTSFMLKMIKVILDSTSNGLSSNGIENLSPSVPYLFISNHRDIILDSAILQKILHENNFPTSEIAFGSNLMDVPLISEIGRANKMFIVKRGGNPRDILKNSTVLSAYIRYALLEKKISVWIAQRNGRTKDGNDKTEIALLKMLNLSGDKSVSENVEALNVVPISMSYEFETCDVEKVKELYYSQNEKYEKRPGEDTTSVIKGVKQNKGKIHLAFGKPLTPKIIDTFSKDSNADFFKDMGIFLDKEIASNYKLWPNNYIAYDLLEDKHTFNDKYSETEKADFVTYLERSIKCIEGNTDDIRKLFLKLYANPIKNNL